MSGLVVFGYGNPSRGDDALGPLLLERAEAYVAEHALADVALVADFQLQIEHADDLLGRGLALFIDADVSCQAPCLLRALSAARDGSYTSHALSPSAVLDVYGQITDAPAPCSFVLSVRGYAFELGAPLSALAAQNLEAAWGLIARLLETPTVEAWTAIAESGAGG